jgi:hypothetical protein
MKRKIIKFTGQFEKFNTSIQEGKQSGKPFLNRIILCTGDKMNGIVNS